MFLSDLFCCLICCLFCFLGLLSTLQSNPMTPDDQKEVQAVTLEVFANVGCRVLYFRAIELCRMKRSMYCHKPESKELFKQQNRRSVLYLLQL
jgi:hypothetical protein